MSFVKSKFFKYLKNLVIGLGASVVMIGALGKINSEPWGGPAITAGLLVEAFLFALLGLLGPEKDYYWEKLYPGLDEYGANISPLTAGPTKAGARSLNADVVENNLGGMLEELQSMSKSLGSLKALQEIDFSQTSEQVKSMSNFYQKINQAVAQMSESADDVVKYKDQISALNNNLSSLNKVYGNMLNAFKA
jgi:hypothetical protein